MQNTYKPYLIHRVECRYDPTSVGIGALCDYDYMGSSEFEYGAVGKSNGRVRHALSAGAVYNILEIPLNKPILSTLNVVHDKIYAMVRGFELFDYGLTYFAFQTNALLEGRIDTKEFCYFDRNFAMWHDLENDVYFSYNETFLRLVHSILSRPTDFAKQVGAQLSIGDEITIAKVLNGKAIHNVDRMEEKCGKVVGILDDAVVIKDYKKYRMPFEYIITHSIQTIKV